MIIGLIKINNIIIIIKIVILVMVNHYWYNNNFYDDKIRAELRLILWKVYGWDRPHK